MKNLIVMAVADGSFSEEEISFLSERCVEWGLGEDGFRDALVRALNDDAALQLPTEPAAQEALLSDLIRTMAADGKLHESEKRLFALAAVKMGIETDRLDALIDRVVQ
ncbi:MAG: TerB family tellurite resistance protein [Pirellulaceae bacterium]